jgi:TonB family protein
MTKIAIALVMACVIVVPPPAGQSASRQCTPPTDIPPCVQSPGDASHYPDNMARPKYPKEALRNGIEGKVELRAVVAPDGKTKDLAVLNGDSAFAQSALLAIRKWRFHSELRKGQPVQTTYKIRVRFNPILREANSDVELESPLPELPAISAFATPHQADLESEVHRVSESRIVAPSNFIRPSRNSQSEHAKPAREAM